MKKLSHQKMIELLTLILHCPVCHNKYSADQANVIEAVDPEKAENASILVHTDCGHCRSSVVFSIVLSGPEIFSVGMITDLTQKDASRLSAHSAVSMDEVIDFHDFIRTSDGDFKRIIK